MTYIDKVTESARERLSGISGRVVVGFSGGADSSVLMTVMAALLGKENITAVHVNHMLRGDDADFDELFCRMFCEVRGIKFVCRRVDVAALSGGKAVEETARNAGYDALLSVARETNSEYIALAHTASDNLETVIFNLCRGSGTAGMRGIPFAHRLHTRGDRRLCRGSRADLRHRRDKFRHSLHKKLYKARNSAEDKSDFSFGGEGCHQHDGRRFA